MRKVPQICSRLVWYPRVEQDNKRVQGAVVQGPPGVGGRLTRIRSFNVNGSNVRAANPGMDLDWRSVLNVAAVVGEWTADDVRALRKALRLSQRAFAAPLAVSQRTVVSWEAGAAISDEFAIRLDDLLRRAEVNVQRRFALRPQSDPCV